MSLGLPVSLKEANIPTDRFKDMSEKAVKLGSIKKMTTEDIYEIYKLAVG
jgi:alcohol dehydrogenase YqhD (iron-dependent ADH family)